MLSIVSRTLRLVAAHWPALLAWFLAGYLARFLLIELAAQVGSFSALGGLMIMPLAILARLISFVAMFLVLRRGMPELGRITGPEPVGRDETRARFLDALFVSILPFFAFYAAWGLLREDMFQYLRGAIDNFYSQPGFFEPGSGSFSDVDRLDVDVVTVGIIVLAFSGRLLIKRYRDKLPRWTALVGVYLEAVWVFMSAYLISDFLGSIAQWVDGRQGMVWLADARAWLGQFAAPLAWVWDGVLWAVGEIGGLVLLPLAWLTIAGVVYGRAVAARAVAAPRPLHVVRQRYGRLPGWVRRRLGDVGQDLVARIRPVWRAILTIWHAGAIPMGVYILLYTAIIALNEWILWGLTRLIGPHELGGFWMNMDTLLILLVMIVLEPVRIALVAAAYDHAVGALTPTETQEVATPASEADAVETRDADEAAAPAPDTRALRRERAAAAGDTSE